MPNNTANITYSLTGAVSRSHSFTATRTGDEYVVTVGTASTSAANMDLATVASPDFLVIKNTGDTNDLLLSFDGGTTFPITILPGESGALPLTSGLTIQAKSSAATTDWEAFAHGTP